MNFVQSASNAAASVTSLAKAFSTPNASGNLLLCCVGVFNFSSVFNDPVVTDSLGNTWTLLLATPRGSGLLGDNCAYLFAAYNCKGGSNTITVTVGTSGTDIDFAIHEYSGCAVTSARDQICSNMVQSGTTLNVGTVTTQFANEVLVSFGYEVLHSGQVFTPSAGWTLRQQTVNPGGHCLASFDELVTTTGTYSQNLSINAASLGFFGIFVTLADTTTPDYLVQQASGFNAASTSLALAFPKANTSGNTLLLCIGLRVASGSLGAISSVTDSNGNIWALVGSSTLQNDGIGHISQAFLFSCSCLSGANTVTVNVASTDDICAIVIEYKANPTFSIVSNSAHSGPSLGSGNLTSPSGTFGFSFAFNATHIQGLLTDFSGTGWRNRVNASVLNPTSTNNPTMSVFDNNFNGGTIEQTITFGSTTGFHLLVSAGTYLPIPSPLGPCIPADRLGNIVNGVFIKDLSLYVGPQTALYTNPVPSTAITVSELNNEGRNSIILDFNQGDGLYARDLGSVLEWPTNLGIQVLVWQPSIIPMPEGIFDRASDWDDGGNPGAKFIQGVIVEAFSFGKSKTFFLQDSDTLTLHTLNECPVTFARQQEIAFSCNPFIAHSTRVISTDGVEWRVWKARIVSQPWPEQTLNWQTELTSLGMTGWAHAREMNLAYLSTTPVTLTLTFDSLAPIILILPSSNGLQNKTKITLPPNKWKLIGFRASSASPFRVFQGDIEVKLREWGAQGPYGVLKPFGGKSSTGAVV